MAQARQQYVADGAYVDKQKKEFTLTDEIIEKLDSIEPSAERNAIQGVKVNGELQTPDQYRVVSLTIPEVVDNLDSYDNKSSLSARQGRVLAQQIKNLQSIGKFLSNWNSTTGLPTSNPSTIPYIYKPGDYYIISVVGSANYRPEGTSFDGSSSSTVEAELVDVGDIYMYDDEGWLLLHNSARVIAVDTSLSTSSTNPVENRVITQALNTKQEKIVAGANIQIAQDGKTISATDTTYDNLPAAQGGTADSLVTTGDKYNWNNKQGTLTAGANIQIAQDGTISATDTVYGAGANVQINGNIISATDTTYVASDFDIKDLADSTGLRAEWSGKQDELIAGTNIQIAADGKTISATDTTYTAGPGISISNNNVISNTQTSAEWGNITGTLSDQTDLQNALDQKLDKVTSTATNPRAYVVNADGSQATLPITDSATSGAIVRRNGTQITVPATPSADTDAASKKYVDDTASGKVSDTAYASSWDGVNTIAPSKNAVYDKISAMDTTISGKQDTLVSGTNIKTINNETILGSGDISINGILSGPFIPAASATYAGRIRFDTMNNKFWKCDGTVWTEVTPVLSVNGGTGAITVNEVKVSSTAPSSPTEGMVWYDTTNDQLKVYDGTNWNVTGKEYNAGEGIKIGTIQDYSAMQGPAPDGFHVPLNTERQAVRDIRTALGGGSSDGTNFGIALKLPFAGYRDYSDSNVFSQGDSGFYWSSTRNIESSAYALDFDSSGVYPQYDYYRAYGFSVRCFKNSPVVPTSSWTKLYGTSIEAGGIFWSSTDGLISLSSDGQIWITIADKNLGATTVWNSGDTVSEANCGKYYQRGNNYGFPRTGTIANQSTTQVDASSYGPGNYYSSDTFIKYDGRWDTTDNGNLWGGVTGVVTLNNAITNTGVLSVNGQTGDVTIESGGLQVSPNSTITGIKYIWYGTESDYAGLSQYYTDVPGDTEFHTF